MSTSATFADHSMRQRRRRLTAWALALVLAVSSLAGFAALSAEPANAAAPPVPVAAFAADLCAGTTELNPSSSGPNGFTDLTQVSGPRLDQYNAGGVVVLYNAYGDGEMAYPPLCGVRFVDGVGPVSEWLFCTDITSKVCGDIGSDGSLQEDETPVNDKSEVSANPRLNAEQERLISYLIQHGHAYDGLGAYTWEGVSTARADGTTWQRWALQTLVWCISDPTSTGPSSEVDRLRTCENTLPAAERARLLELATASVTLALETTTVSLEVGEVAVATLSTNLYERPITITTTPDTEVTLCGTSTGVTLVGDTLTITGEGSLESEVELCFTSPTAQTIEIAASATQPSPDHLQWNQSQGNVGVTCQVFATFLPVADTRLASSASVQFLDEPVPSIGTTLLDAWDADKYIWQAGNTVIDEVAYEGLTVGVEYVLNGELFDKATGEGTGITGAATFTPSEAAGVVEVEFEIPAGYAGATLVAFEWLSQGETEVASHEDIEDVDQTVYVADIYTSLLDAADGDRNVTAAGGTVIDTITYTNLRPNHNYIVSGELMDKATGEATDIAGQTYFTTGDTGNGTVDVEFTIDDTWAGSTLVAFEYLTETTGGDNGPTVVAVHTDINDAAQTVTVGDVPLIGTTLVDALDGDKYVIQSGGVVVDTIAYENLEPSTEYTVTGELMDQETAETTGITGSATFTSTDTGTGTVEVEFTIPAEFAGRTLTAFEVVSLGDVEVAWHEDITDVAQTVYVADIGTTLLDAADGDKNVTAAGGTVIDTVAYTNLVPNTEYVVAGQLFDKATGIGTGILGATTFTSSDTGSGTVDVEFVIADGWAGRTLVAFETVTLGDLVVAVHQDINDEAQTVVVDELEPTPTPSTPAPSSPAPTSPAPSSPAPSSPAPTSPAPTDIPTVTPTPTDTPNVTPTPTSSKPPLATTGGESPAPLLAFGLLALLGGAAALGVARRRARQN